MVKLIFIKGLWQVLNCRLIFASWYRRVHSKSVSVDLCKLIVVSFKISADFYELIWSSFKRLVVNCQSISKFIILDIYQPDSNTDGYYTGAMDTD